MRLGRARAAAKRTTRLALADGGVGPLLQRDYWAVIRDCRGSPEDVMAYVSRHFERFAPREFVNFEREKAPNEPAPTPGEPLEPGTVLKVHIVAAGDFRVRVTHRDSQSLTLATVKGHPEAGRITFGAYRNAHDDVIFHIRSRARSGSRKHYLGFLGVGESMQTTVWTDFVNRVAACTGDGVRGWIYANTAECADEPPDEQRVTPTFEARGN